MHVFLHQYAGLRYFEHIILHYFAGLRYFVISPGLSSILLKHVLAVYANSIIFAYVRTQLWI